MGVENREVTQYMLLHPRRDLNRICFPTGKKKKYILIQFMMNSWINHKLRTENNKTPCQLFITKLQRIFNKNQDALPEYGMDPDAPLPEPGDEANIDVPSIELINEEQLHSFNVKMRGMHVADVSDIDPYLHALDSVDEALEH
ncbi:hypothetical protein ACJMK2_028372 [Sinanodonta woodiana]|uniref:Integrase core domain-containing protein n=1 Tax=Sinanodonta woodiana TaxID=1069815 RepID=A0ABD3X785_SINWO